METAIKSSVKIASIGQCIVQAVRTRSAISFVVGVEVAHKFGSRWLVDQLTRLGFCVTYEEVQRYKQSILLQKQVENSMPIGQFTQWVADNADHNMAKIDGKATFHGMGMIAATNTPSDIAVASLPVVMRRKKVTVKDLM